MSRLSRKGAGQAARQDNPFLFIATPNTTYHIKQFFSGQLRDRQCQLSGRFDTQTVPANLSTLFSPLL
jgi:hypothetical protein